ncbi:monoacylglycerol lipase ABHD6-like isoform X2 [Gigantopelta aegis]|uniref:monoacylglycerol lipase ABHD6-like isoform X2 n=1 Tax=Gigantopelta aegis TaxID=1735272 RepID=UPI001B88E292|nr:monoacylglycerol lipase ABHD6-like isoform X2 [Gigantopelta aegis]
MMWMFILYPLATAVVGLISIYFFFPQMLVQLGLRLYQYLSHMEIKYIGEDGFIYCYAERGRPTPGKSSILFIHGFTASKDQFMQFFKKLSHDIHLVAVDLPGHGATSTPSESEDVSFDLFLEKIHTFVELVGLDKSPFHLIGTSLGGAISGLYASRYPEQIERLTLICPAMKTPTESDFFKQVDKAIEKGDEFTVHDCSLLPQDAEALQNMLDMCVYHKTKIDKQLLKGLVEIRKPRNEFFLKMFKKLSSVDNKKLLEEIVHKLTMPTHLIWGKHDELVHISGVDLLRNGLPNCQQVDVLERCGHNVDLDRPGATMKAILQFRGELTTRRL